MDSIAYLIDDDPFFASAFKEVLSDVGITCQIFPSVEKFETTFPGEAPKYLIIDLAVPLGDSTLVNITDARGGHETGIALIRKIRNEWKDTLLVLITGNPSVDAQKWCEQNGVQYVLKPIDRQMIERILALRKLRAFVVHGRNVQAVEKTKDVLSRIDIEPIVLMEQPNKGRTVIEKFEEVSSTCDCAIVALTPDDIGSLAEEDLTQAKNRARQNVIFELGYFCGSFGRQKGRVVLIEFGELEIPSDLSGVVRLNGQKTIDELSAEVLKEFRGLLVAEK